MNFKGNSLQNPILNRRLSKSTSNRTVTRHRPVPPTFITESPDLRKASVFSDSTWETDSDIYLDSDDENGATLALDDGTKFSLDEQSQKSKIKNPTRSSTKSSLRQAETLCASTTDTVDFQPKKKSNKTPDTGFNEMLAAIHGMSANIDKLTDTILFTHD